MIEALRSRLSGEVFELSAYRADIRPCVDCRFCHSHARCAVDDDMREVYSDDYESIVVASPVYYGSLTPPVLAIASRLQIYHAAKHFRGEPIARSSKRGAVLLAGGGKGNPDEAKRVSRVILRILGAGLEAENIVASLNTDEMPARLDAAAIGKAREIGARLAGSII
jgi:multimeric flavodoxin WrbA